MPGRKAAFAMHKKKYACCAYLKLNTTQYANCHFSFVFFFYREPSDNMHNQEYVFNSAEIAYLNKSILPTSQLFLPVDKSAHLKYKLMELSERTVFFIWLPPSSLVHMGLDTRRMYAHQHPSTAAATLSTCAAVSIFS